MSPAERDGPLAAATRELVGWLGATAGVPVRVAPPADRDGVGGIAVWPLELGPDQEVRGTGRRGPMRLRLRYLVCPDGAAGDDPAGGAATRLLDRLLVAAAIAGEPAIVLEPLPAPLWQAFGVPPRAVLLLDVPVRVDRPDPTAPLVRRPLEVRDTPLQALHGRVVGPGDVPLSGMRVEVTSTGQATHTDAGGRFAFAGVPAGSAARLRLQGRGRQLLADVDALSESVVIHCDIEES